MSEIRQPRRQTAHLLSTSCGFAVIDPAGRRVSQDWPSVRLAIHNTFSGAEIERWAFWRRLAAGGYRVRRVSVTWAVRG